MRRSKYDRNHDGVCDAIECSGIRAVTREDGPNPRIATLLTRDLERIGIHLRVGVVPNDAWTARCQDHSTHVALCLGDNWEADYPSPENFFSLEFTRSGLHGCCNESLVGASSRQLTRWGYSVGSVPNVGDRIRQCA